MSAQTWRIVLADGTVREVVVRAGHSFTDGVVYFARLSPTDTMVFGADPRGAVLRLAVARYLDVAEILAPGEPTRAELRAQVEAYAAQLAPMTRAVDALRAAAVAAGHPAADGDPDAQLRAVRAQAFREGAETMRGAVVQDPHMVLSDYDERRIRDLPVPPCPEVSR